MLNSKHSTKSSHSIQFWTGNTETFDLIRAPQFTESTFITWQLSLTTWLAGMSNQWTLINYNVFHKLHHTWFERCLKSLEGSRSFIRTPKLNPSHVSYTQYFPWQAIATHRIGNDGPIIAVYVSIVRSVWAICFAYCYKCISAILAQLQFEFFKGNFYT